MKLIIDTDMGIDDAIALLMVLAHPEAEIEAITSVVGNVSLAQATHNVGVVLDVAEAPAIPIYQGCSRPLLQDEPENAYDFHGADGLGGAGRAETSRIVAGEHASLALIRLAREKPGELTLLTLGPLTNVALAIRLDPTFLQHLKRLIIMAGAVDGRGNTSPSAEFNIAVDPEAAKIVFDALSGVGSEVWLVPWEAGRVHGVSVATWEKLIEGDSPLAQFVQQMTPYLRHVVESSRMPALLWPDPLAAAVALAPDLVLREEHRFVDLEIGGGPARGQTVVDYRFDSTLPPNMRIVREVDMPKFQALLRQAVQSGKEK